MARLPEAGPETGRRGRVEHCSDRCGCLWPALVFSLLALLAGCAGSATPGPPLPSTVAAPLVMATPESTTPVSRGAATTPATQAPASPGEAVVLEVGVNGEALEFDVDSLSVPAGASVFLSFDNSSIIYQHNWVLVAMGTKDDVSTAAAEAGPEYDWVPPDDRRVLAATGLLDAGVTGSVSFTAPAAGAYEYVCTFPGHNFTMHGEFVVTE